VNQPDNRWRTRVEADNPGVSPATVDVLAEAEEPGVVRANAGTITVIATPVTGWLAVTNAADARPGVAADTDPQLRTRRELELSRSGTATVPAITADLADVVVNDERVVAAVFVEENPGSFYDYLRRPPHTLEAVVQFLPGLAGADLAAARQALAEQLWRSKPAGIDTVGAQSATVVDSRGAARTVRWTEPTEVLVHVSAALRVNPARYAGVLAVGTSVLEYGAGLRIGESLIRARLLCALVDVAGVTDVVGLFIGRTAGSLRQANLAIGPRELAVLDSSRITVTIVGGG
jgi:uncharacterized phage protein gp47/JayE